MRKLKMNKRMIGLLIICILILAAVTGVFLDRYAAVSRYTYSDLAVGSSTIGSISEGVEVIQEIPYKPGSIGVSVQFATYARYNNGDVTVKITGRSTQNTYMEKTMPAASLVDNAYVDFCFDREIAEDDTILQLFITSTSNNGDGVTIWATSDDALPGYDLTINGNEIAGDLTVREIDHAAGYPIVWFIYGMIMLCIVVFFILVCQSNVHLENIYLAIVLPLGIIYMFMMTPFAIPDEPNHYQSSFKLSNVLCFQWNDLELGDAQYFDDTDFVGHHNVGSAYIRVANDIFLPAQAEGPMKIPTPNGIIYPVMLMPQAVGITIGRLLNANSLITFYLGRFCNLLFFVLCVYFAIKKTTRFKLLFCMLGIMPMALHQAASYSYDAFINGMVILFIALTLRVIDAEGQIQIRDLLPAAITGVLLCPAKVVYSLVLLLLMLIQRRRFHSFKRYIIVLGTIALFGLLAIVVIQLPSLKSVATSAGAGSGSAAQNWEGGRNYTLSFILHNPAQTTQIFLQTLKTRGWDWLLESIGHVFAGYSFLVVDRPIMLYLFLLILSAFKYGNRQRTVSGMERVLFCLVSIGIILATMLSMFLAWTSDTSYIINGIQGRYFIPVLALLLMCLNNSMITIRRPIEKVLLLLGLLFNFEIVFHVLFTTITL